jgi:hypothetical protein
MFVISTARRSIQLHLRNSLARVRPHSQWIYSSRSEEMVHANPGRIYVCSKTTQDPHSCTLRIHRALQGAHLVLAHHPHSTLSLLTALANKRPLAEREEE